MLVLPKYLRNAGLWLPHMGLANPLGRFGVCGAGCCGVTPVEPTRSCGPCAGTGDNSPERWLVSISGFENNDDCSCASYNDDYIVDCNDGACESAGSCSWWYWFSSCFLPCAADNRYGSVGILVNVAQYPYSQNGAAYSIMVSVCAYGNLGVSPYSRCPPPETQYPIGYKFWEEYSSAPDCLTVNNLTLSHTAQCSPALPLQCSGSPSCVITALDPP
jgi:hypothetical protein